MGFISRRWSDFIGKFMSHFCDYLSISEQYSHLHCLLQDNSQRAHFQKETLSSEVGSTQLLSSYLIQVQLLKFGCMWELIFFSKGVFITSSTGPGALFIQFFKSLVNNTSHIILDCLVFKGLVIAYLAFYGFTFKQQSLISLSG